MTAGAPAITRDHLLGGRLVLAQPAKGHRAGTDSMLALALARGLGGRRIADFGAGVGLIGLGLARLDPAVEAVTLVEVEPSIHALALDNVRDNDLADRVCAVCVDLSAPARLREAAGLSRGFDLVVFNPPFRRLGRERVAADATRRRAHLAPASLLFDWVRAAAHHGAPGGRVAFIEEAGHVADVLSALDGRFGALRLRFVHARADEPATRLLVVGVKGARAAPRILPPLVIHRADGAFTPAGEAVNRGEAIEA
jgi:tRNA1(Val) A37 N6-methylase TrmN6